MFILAVLLYVVALGFATYKRYYWFAGLGVIIGIVAMVVYVGQAYSPHFGGKQEEAVPEELPPSDPSSPMNEIWQREREEKIKQDGR